MGILFRLPFPASRLIGTPRKRTISAREVCMDDQAKGWSAHGCRGATARVWRSGARPVGRMSRQRKRRRFSRELGVTAATLTNWHDAFLAAGEAALTTRAVTGEELESDRLKARLG